MKTNLKLLIAIVIISTATINLYAATYYVNANQSDDSGDGLSWATAKQSIQAAVNLAASNDTIIVTNGIYSPISSSNKLIVIKSVNGADVTTIDGNGTNCCARLGSNTSHTNTFLEGFTLQNGSNNFGGGSYGGTLNNCTLINNTAGYGGGSYHGILNNCTLTNNTAEKNGGGVYGGILNNCTLKGNYAIDFGGGVSMATLNNCTLIENSAANNSMGGGASHSTLNNCLLIRNTATYGGASAYGTLNNCTLIENRNRGSYGSTLNNCIIWNNTQEVLLIISIIVLRLIILVRILCQQVAKIILRMIHNLLIVPMAILD